MTMFSLTFGCGVVCGMIFVIFLSTVLDTMNELEAKEKLEGNNGAE